MVSSSKAAKLASSRQGSVEDSDAAQSTSSSNRRGRKRPAFTATDDDTGAKSNSEEDVAASTPGTPRNHVTTAASGASGSRPLAFESPNEARHRIMSVFHRQPATTSSAARTELPTPSPSADDSQSLEQHPSPRRNLGPTLSSLPQSPFSSYLPNASPFRNTRSNTIAVPPLSSLQAAAPATGSSGMTRSLSHLTNLSVNTQTSNNNNMSPPRPTRSLPRRNASARTLSRPVALSSNNPSSTSQALRARSASNSTVLSNTSSNANILASGQSLNRQNVPTGCGPFSGAFDPYSNPPSGLSTPRTPLAEIPLWLADMRSESRRSSSSSTSFMDRDDWLTSMQPSTRHSRTASLTSNPPSPGVTRNESPALPFRRSQRARHPRQSDENARLSPSLDEYDAMGESADAFAPSMPLMPSTSSQGQTSSPAMSTRSRTLGRTSSARRPRRMTNSLSAPVLNLPDLQPNEFGQTNLLGLGVELVNTRNSRSHSRSNSRTRSPSRATRSLRRRSVMVENNGTRSAEESTPGPLPRPLAPLQIPTAGLQGDLAIIDAPSGLLAEPISPSAFSEMTSLTQGSTAAESSSSFGPPPTPSSASPFDRERLSFADNHIQHRLRSTRSVADPALDPNDKIAVPDDDQTLLDNTVGLGFHQPR